MKLPLLHSRNFAVFNGQNIKYTLGTTTTTILNAWGTALAIQCTVSEDTENRSHSM